MIRGVIYIGWLFFLSIVLFYFAASVLKTETPLMNYFLAMIVTHLVLEKNPWLIDLVQEMFDVSSEGNQTDE
ncbi:short-chain dehydrogenase [Thalassobacillus hwangdonensis]|uniref:Short-chain dehydrogenase n=1 Tax=Thalassobacillus hwangdonensis TaxID=546108 RepID=A0ABW3L220_9BACI